MEVYPNLYVGSKMDVEFGVYPEGIPDFHPSIIHACKYPCYRDKVGYVSCPALSSSNKDYFYIEEEKDLYLNIVDADDPKYFPTILFTKAFEFINKHIDDKSGVFIHCNRGGSRSPGIAMMYMMLYTNEFKDVKDYSEMVERFKIKYPYIHMAKGMTHITRECFDNPSKYLSI